MASVSRSEMIVENDKVYYIGSDLKVHNYWRDASGKWNENVLLSTMQPAIANSGLVKDQQGSIYYVGNDGFIYKCVFNSGWIVTKIIPTGNWLAVKNDSRLAIAFPSTQTRIYYVATDSKIHYILNNGSTWSSDILIAGSSAVRVNSPLLAEGTNKVYYIGSDAQIKNQFLSGSIWLDGPLNVSAQAVRPNSELDIDELGKIYYIGQDNKIHRFTWLSSWTELPLNSSAPTVANFCNFTYNNGQVFYKGTDGFIKSIYSNGGLFSNVTNNTTTHQNLSVWKTHFQNNIYGASYYFDVNGFLHRITENIQTSPITIGNGKKYERFEIGVDLPNNLDNDINNFCNNAHNNPPYLIGSKNPYDPDQIKVRAVFTNGTDSYVRYGFFYRDVTPPNSGAYQYTINPSLSSYPFRIRIAPEKTGNWNVNIELYVNNVIAYSTSSSFIVDPSSRKGPLSLPNANRYLKDANNNDFFVIGQNADCDWRWDGSSPDAKYIASSSLRSDFDQQRSAIIDLASKNANFVRLRMLPHGYDLEGAHSYLQNLPVRSLEKNLNNYDTRQYKAWELDQTIKTLEDYNVYAMLNIFYDPSFSYYPTGDIAPLINQNSWHYNPYSTLYFPVINSDPNANGTSHSNLPTSASGSVNVQNSIYNFFKENNSSSNVFKKIQNKLFYIMARWGYSPNIAMWQIMNETENTGDIFCDNPNSMFNKKYKPTTSDPWFNIVLENWITSVNSYLKSFYPVKLTINGRGGEDDPVKQSQTLDLLSNNYYNANVWDNLMWKFPAQKNLSSPYWNGTSMIRKGFLSSEQGTFGEVDWCLDVEAHNSIWSGIFTGQLGTPLYFWDQWQANGVDHRSKFTSVYNFITSVSLNDDWSKYVNSNTGHSFVYSPGEPHAIKKVENFYMVNSNKETSIGWVHNYSYNWYGLQVHNSLPYPNCPNIQNFNPNYTNYTATEYGLYTINTAVTNCFPLNSTSQEPCVVVENLLPNSSYMIEYFDTRGGYYNGNIQFAISDALGKIYLDVSLSNDLSSGSPDFAYKITKQNGQRTATLIKELSETKDFDIYPNPSNGIIFLKSKNVVLESIEVFNLLGQSIMKIDGNQSKELRIDLSKEKGNFVNVKITDVQGNITIKKCILSK